MTKLSIVRGGGLAGLVTRSELSSDALSDDDVGLLENYVQNAGMLTYAATEPDDASQPNPDEFNFEVTIERDGASRTVRAPESAMPEALAALVAWMEKHPHTERSVERPMR